MAPDAGTAAAPTAEPMAVYRALRQRGLLQPDPAQQLAIERLQSLYRALLHYRPETGLRGWLARFGLAENGGSHAPVGLYLCGPVGRGKSMLMDLFFRSVPSLRKRRVHFHAFMLEVHDRIERERRAQTDQPIAKVAQRSRRRGGAVVLRRVSGRRHRRCDDPRTPVQGAVRRRGGGRRDLEPRAGRALRAWSAARALSAVHRAAQTKALCARARQRARLPARPAARQAGLPPPARRGGARRARTRLCRADRWGIRRQRDPYREGAPARRPAGGARRRLVRLRRISAPTRSAPPITSRSPSASPRSSSKASRASPRSSATRRGASTS